MADVSEPLAPPRPEPSGPGASILLVDDNPANLLSLRAILEDLGHDLVEARSGEEALRRVRSEEFAVVLLEVVMPGIGGFETARLIRRQARSPHTPVIFLTASDIDRPQIEAGYALGAVDFLVKPLLAVVLQSKVRGFVELFRDKQRAKREADQLRLLVHGTTEYAIFMLDPHGRVVTWNAGAERFKGYTADEIIGRHFTQFYPQEAIDRGWPEHELKVAGADGRFEDEGWRVRKDGTQFWANVVITALRDEHGQVRGFSKVTRDLTERKKAEENARRLLEESTARRVAEENARLVQEQRERLHVTLASIGDAVISTDAEGRVNFLNPVAQELVGWKNEEAAHRPLADVFRIVNEDTRQPVENPAMRALKEGVVVGLANHTVLIAKDGKERPIDDSAAPIRDIGGNVVGSVLVFRDISERKRVQEELRESEGRFRGLMEQAPFSIQVFSPDGRTVRVNRAWEELWGVTLDQVADYNILEDQQLEAKGVLPYIRRAFAGEAVEIPAIGYDPNETLPDRTRHADSLRWVSAVAYPIKDGAGRVREVILVHQDITARKKAEEERRRSDERTRIVLESITDAFFAVDRDWRFTYVNPQAERVLDRTPGDLLGRVLWHEYPGLAGSEFERAYRRAAAERVSVTAYYPDHDRWYKAHVYPAADGISVYFRDVSERKRAKAELDRLTAAAEQQRRIYETALSNTADFNYVFDRRGRFVYVNRALLALWGRGLPEAVGKDFFELGYPPELADRLQRQIREVIAIRQPVKDETPYTSGVGERQYEYIFVPVLAADGSVEAVAGSTRDITERKRVEEALRAADRRKDEFLATLAHELRNPLGPIRNALQILKMPRVDAATVERSRGMMERQVDQLVRLVDDLLDVSRVMRGKIELRRERVELATVVARAVETVQPLVEVQGHRLEIAIPPESLPLDADPVRLAQVVGNLLTNAAKYTDSNGRIRLTAERDGDVAVLRVRDTGIGIATPMLPRIFELFVQVDHASTKAQGGLGIGLTLVKNLVEMHDGTVEARSEGLGKGSEFVVRLPLSTQAVDRERGGEVGEQDQQPPSPSGYRLLVVDDNQDAADSLAVLLRLQGHEVRVAHSGPAALEVTKGYTPDVVFLDIGMPGMDGYEVARRLRQQPGVGKVVLAALTGWGQKEDRRRTAEAGFDHHLVKPPEQKAVEGVLAELKRPDAR